MIVSRWVMIGLSSKFSHDDKIKPRHLRITTTLSVLPDKEWQR